MGHEVTVFHRAQLEEPEYMQMVRAIAAKTTRYITETAAEQQQGHIVEVGAGSGILSLLLVDSVIAAAQQGIKVELIISEPDPDLIAFAAEYITSSVQNKELYTQLVENGHIRFVQMNAQDIKMLRLNPDIVVSTEVLHHIPYEHKIPVIQSIVKLLARNGAMLIGDNFVADRYAYIDTQQQPITDRAILAPKVAALLKEFWDALFAGEKWPDSFVAAHVQQQKGLVECKTSLPHTVALIAAGGGIIKAISPLSEDVCNTGGYAILEVAPATDFALQVRSYMNDYTIKQAYGGLQYDPLKPGLSELAGLTTNLELGVVTQQDANSQYPDPQLEGKLVKAISDIICLYTKARTNIVVGAGSDQLLERLTYLLSNPGFMHILPTPAYYSHLQYTCLNGCSTIQYAYKLTRAAPTIIEHLNKLEVPAYTNRWQGALWLTNPHNPTGLLLDLQELRTIIRAAAHKNIVVIVDEAYGEFSDIRPFSSSALNCMEEFSNILVLRSVSKGPGVAGIRVGYIATQDDLLSKALRIHLPQFPISLSSLRTGLEVMCNYERITTQVKQISTARQNFFLKQLQNAQSELQLRGIELQHVPPSVITCMIWARNNTGASIDLHQYLLEHGISVMSLKNIPNVPKNAIRVTMGPEEDIKTLFTSLLKLLA
jgi:histidinol-phosphate/aromatic aminotransferase/cobyric acid decarboxylase-like protein